MTQLWTTQRVVDLAPDAASAKAGRGQMSLSKWVTRGRSSQALWGEVQGSGKLPYQVRVDLAEPAFKCSCPSRKFPCKHALGLMLILAENAGALSEGDPPAWVAEWLASRQQRSQQREQRSAATSEQPVDPAAQAKRAASRESKVQAGVEELAQFLLDLIRQGFAAAQAQPSTYWQHAAARLIDAQAPGLARLVRQLGDTIGSGGDWQSRFLRQLGRLHLAVQGYRRLQALSPATQSELRAIVGWTVATADVLAQPAVSGTWLVVGRRIEIEERLTVQRTWLIERSNGRPALILDFAVGNQTLDGSLLVGCQFEAELVYYPGSLPLRGLVKQRLGELATIAHVPGAGIDAALDSYAAALGCNPWLEQWPMALAQVLPAAPGDGDGPENWTVCDAAGNHLPLAPGFAAGYDLLAVSGGRPITLVGEWDGDQLNPLAVCCQGSFYAVGRRGDGEVLVRAG
jgi:hypothetical protein